MVLPWRASALAPWLLDGRKVQKVTGGIGCIRKVPWSGGAMPPRLPEESVARHSLDLEEHGRLLLGYSLPFPAAYLRRSDGAQMLPRPADQNARAAIVEIKGGR